MIIFLLAVIVLIMLFGRRMFWWLITLIVLGIIAGTEGAHAGVRHAPASTPLLTSFGTRNALTEEKLCSAYLIDDVEYKSLKNNP
ncbi:hypothetical protein [Burkholderia guangdongensis]|uniref:hypothetical protein n=1 Tax=Burkholderia guangdongensis TaxID=1792500 RepID=UPI0015CCEF16|nr:hypothetical protein [Burkholderia guangdongensis]